MKIIKKNWSDQQLSRFILEHDLKLHQDLKMSVNYYYSGDYSIELLIFFDNEKTERTIYRSV